MTTGRARLVDVARLASVSTSIASRILNGDSSLHVRDDTRRRVREAAGQLGYRPHAAARAVRAGTLGAVGLVIPDFVQPVYARIVRGAVRRAHERGVVVLVSEDPGDGSIGQAAEAMVRRLLSERRIDGLIVSSIRPGHPVIDVLREAGIPHVFANRRLPGSGRNVSMDDAAASTAAVEHLVALGHEVIGLVAGPPGLDPSDRRQEGFVDAVRAHGLEPLVVHAAFTNEGGRDGTLGLLAEHPGVTAVYTSNFGQGMGALAALSAAGRRVPADCSVITYDDLPAAAFLTPALTGIDMPLAEMGAAALDAVLAQIEGHQPQDVQVPSTPAVVVRDSTGPAPRRES